MRDDPEIQDNAAHSRWGCAVVMLVVLLILYVLSPPLLVIVYEASPEPVQSLLEPLLEAFFTPLQWLYDNFEAVQAFYEWYGELFGVL